MNKAIWAFCVVLGLCVFIFPHASFGQTTYAVYGVIDSFAAGTDADGDGFYETFTFNIGVDADASPGPTTVYAKMICNTTGQSWWSTTSWTVTGTPTDYHYFSFSQADFAGFISGNTSLDFTVEIWNSTKTTLLASDTTVVGEPVKADYIAPTTYAVYGVIDSFVGGADQDGDNYYEGFTFYIRIDADASPGPATIYAKMICNTTGQSWWSENSWTVTGTANDFQYFAFSQADFAGHLNPNTSLDFTVELWNAGKTTLLASDTTITGEPVRADVLTDDGPRIGTGIGLLGDAKTHIDSYYNTFLVDEYELKDITRRASMNVHGHNGQMSADAVIQTETPGFLSIENVMEDADDVWNAADQKAGVDAHVYAGRVYDYFLSQLGLNSYDDGGVSMYSVVECTGSDLVDNAAWGGDKVRYGIASSNPRSYAAALDVSAHEWAHAVTEKAPGARRSQLNYEKQSGALNEAFSDWVGTAVDRYYGNNNWTIGESVAAIRDLSNPPLYGQPDHMDDISPTEGCTPTGGPSGNDYCYVHHNSGIPNKMFYLLANGGTHHSITVSGLGIQTAIQISLDANVNYWTEDETFQAARDDMIIAAGPYGANAVDQVKNAWAAVGVGTIITVAATDATAGEPATGQGTGAFMFSRTGSTAASLTVNFTVGGSATSGSDYASLGTTVSFAAGSATATKTVSVNEDSTVENDETVVVTLASGSGYTVGSPSSATVTIKDDDATVTIATTDATAGEPGTGQGSGMFTFTRSGFTAGALTVNFTVGGSATSGSDYTALGTTVSFAAGSATATKTLSVNDDLTVENDETVVVTLASGSGYTVGSPSSATVTIKDDDATVTVAATDATAGEPGTGQGNGAFTFTRNGFTGGALTVNFTVGGSATSGSDYSTLGTTVSFTAGSSAATKTVSVNDDSIAETDETVVLTLASGTGYTVGSPASATITIKDDDQPPLTVLSRSPSSLTASCTQGQNASSQNFEVWNSGAGSMSYSISDDAAWLSVSPISGASSSEHDTIQVDYSTTGLSAGTYNATITITASGASGSPQTIAVTLVVSASGYTISGHVRTPLGVGLSGAALGGLPTSTLTDANGFYSATVPNGWSGTVTPSMTVCEFSPSSRGYPSVNGNQPNQDYTGYGSTDSDGDGRTDWEEYISGTDPTNANSVLRITAMEKIGADVRISFTSVNSKYYCLERCDYMGGAWTTVADNVPGTGAIRQALDINGASRSSAFYRVRLNQSPIPASVDSDGDGIPDTWMQLQFGHPTGLESDHSCAGDDPDGDGLFNLREYLTGTCPTNSASAFRILSVTQEGNNLRVKWFTAGGRTNVVRSATSIAGNYHDVSSNIIIPGTGETTTNYLDVGAVTNGPALFYRVQLVP